MAPRRGDRQRRRARPPRRQRAARARPRLRFFDMVDLDMARGGMRCRTGGRANESIVPRPAKRRGPARHWCLDAPPPSARALRRDPGGGAALGVPRRPARLDVAASPHRREPTALTTLLARRGRARRGADESAAQAHDGGPLRRWRDEATARVPVADRRRRQVPLRRQELSPAPRGAAADQPHQGDPQEPTAFVKLNSSLVGHRAKVVRPEGIVRLDYEPELVFVIGRRALGVRRPRRSTASPA